MLTDVMPRHADLHVSGCSVDASDPSLVRVVKPCLIDLQRQLLAHGHGEADFLHLEGALARLAVATAHMPTVLVAFREFSFLGRWSSLVFSAQRGLQLIVLFSKVLAVQANVVEDLKYLWLGIYILVISVSTSLLATTAAAKHTGAFQRWNASEEVPLRFATLAWISGLSE